MPYASQITIDRTRLLSSYSARHLTYTVCQYMSYLMSRLDLGLRIFRGSVLCARAGEILCENIGIVLENGPKSH